MAIDKDVVITEGRLILPGYHGSTTALRGPRHARYRRDLDARRVVGRGVALRVAVERAELHQVAQREITALGHQRVDHGRDVADREVPVVALRPLRVRRVDVELVEEQGRSEVGGGKRPAGMAGLRLAEQRDDVPPDVERLLGELFD